MCPVCMAVEDYKFSHMQNISGMVHGLVLKKTARKYEIIYPELLDNGTVRCISRNLVRMEFDKGTGEFKEIIRYNIESFSGLTTPLSFRNNIGYDFDNDRILVILGEWDGTSNDAVGVTIAKLIAIDREAGTYEILINDLLGLISGTITGVDELRYYASAVQYNGLLVVVVGTYSAGSEVSTIIISTDGGATWSVINANTRYNYIQEDVIPFLDGDVFMGFLTEGHGTNSHWIKPDGSIVAGAPSGTAYTTEPCYDPINNKVIWGEWGSTTGAVQHIHVADPSDPFGTATDVTPTGTLTDSVGNSLDLSTLQKSNIHILDNGKMIFISWLYNVASSESRIVMTDTPPRAGGVYELVLTPTGSDRFTRDYVPAYRNRVKLKCYDLASKKATTLPLIIAPPIVG